MALHSLRFRRALASVYSLHRSLSSTIPSISSSHILEKPTPLSSSLATIFCKPGAFSLTRVSFCSSSPSTISSPPKVSKRGEEITRGMAMFEGCDYNHWFITVDFPKEAKPSPEEMVRCYEEICAKGLNISLEEAKKRIYACSTSTYEGFQATMTEEESEKFRDIPQVIFVLPDTYGDPVNKEYGGDKYENGVITHRPRPSQNHRTGGRFRDRQNRNADRGRYDQQGGQAPSQQGFMQRDGRNYGPSQNYSPSQNYPPLQNYSKPLKNYSGFSDQASMGGSVPSHKGNHLQVGPQGSRGDYPPPGQGGYAGDDRDYTQTQGQMQGANPGNGQG